MSRRTLLLVFGIAISLAAVACSSGDSDEAGATVDAPSATVVDVETAYFAGIEEILESNDRIGQTMDELIGDRFPTFAPDNIQAFVILNALREAEIGERYAEANVMAQALVPPEKYAIDHAAFLARAKQFAELGVQVDEAVAADDLAHVHLARAQIAGQSSLSLLVDFSPEFCRQVVPEEGPPGSDIDPAEICNPPESPGGEYGVSVELLVDKWTMQFGPLVSLSQFAPGMGDDQLMRATGYIQPLITNLFEEVTFELAALTPPTEYGEGHTVLTQYFDELFATSNAIDVAVAEGDFDKMIREFERSGEVSDAIQDRMPENYKEIVPGLFGGP